MEGGDFGIMASIDERVVEMRFNRDDFLKGTEQTLTALEKLDQRLGNTGALSSGLETMGNRFSALGVVAAGALLKMGSMAVDAGTKIVSNIMEPIFGGGKRRALNLEQANFQLLGLLKTAPAVDAVMANVKEAVDGTAYGLDAAAIAASQFAASGMRGGEAMKNALRGISGVAAMAGSSYEDIANVFTKVAGQGRLMGDDLNRLASRGINAAATLAEQMGVSEEAVRDMVTKGKISFAQFSESMNIAFGDHAKKANETYAGSLSNLKAAFARIGAEYFIVEHEKLRRIFNALRPVVNAFKGSIEYLIRVYNVWMAIPLAERIEKLGAALTSWKGWEQVGLLLGSILYLIINALDVLKAYLEPIGAAFKEVFGGGDTVGPIKSLQEWLHSLSAKMTLFGAKVREVQSQNTKNFFVTFFTAAKKGFELFQKAFDVGWKIIKSAWSGLMMVFDATRPLFDVLGQGISAFWEILMKGIEWVSAKFDILKPYIIEVFDYLFGQEGRVRKFFQNFRDEIHETGSIFTTLGNRAKALAEKYIKPVIDVFNNLQKAFEDLKKNGPAGFQAAIGKAFAPLGGLWDFIKSIGKKSGDIFKWLKSPFKWFADQLPTINDLIQRTFAWVSDRFATAMVPIDGLFEAIGKGLEMLTSGLGKLVENVDAATLITLVEAIARLALIFRLVKTFESAQGAFDSIKGFFGGLTASISGFADAAKTTAKGQMFLMVAGGVLILAAAVWVLSKIPADALIRSGVAMIALMGALALLVKAVAVFDVKKTLAAAGVLLAIGGAMIQISIAALILGLIPIGVLQQGLMAVLTLLFGVSGAAAMIGKEAPQLGAAALGITAIAGSIALLIIPVRQFGEMDVATLQQGLLTILVLLLGLSGAAVMVGELGAQGALGALSIVAIAGALTLLIIPIQTFAAMDMASLGNAMLVIIVALIAMSVAAQIAAGAITGGLAILAVAGALAILAGSIWLLAQLPADVVGNIFLMLGATIVVLVAAAYAAMGALPGFIAVALTLAAVAVVALAVGIATVLMATSLVILGFALPIVVAGLIQFAGAWQSVLIAIPLMYLLGPALLILGAGALVAGIGLALVAAAMILFALSLPLIAAFGPLATTVLVAFLAAIADMWTQVAKIALVSTAIAALGAAIAILGAGLIVAAAGLVLFALGAAIAAIGLGILAVMASLSTRLIPDMVERMKLLDEAVGPLQRFMEAVVPVADAITRLGSAAQNATIGIALLVAVVSALGAQMAMLGTAVLMASQVVAIALLLIVSAVDSSAARIMAGILLISASFMMLSMSVPGKEVALAITVMMMSISMAISAGGLVIGVETRKIVQSFILLAVLLMATAGPITVSVRLISDGIARTLSDGSRSISISILGITMMFATMSVGILRNRSMVMSAVRTVTSGITSTLDSSRSSVDSSAYSVGMAIANGMARGIAAGSSRVRAAAGSVAQAALVSAKQTLGVQSPSKAFHAIGGYSIDGFVGGFTDGIPTVKKTSYDVAKASVDSLRQTFSRLMDASGIEDLNPRPTITPVLDLSLAEAQARGLSDLLGGDLNVGTSMTQAAGLAMLDEALRGVKSGESGPTTSVTYVQNNNSPKALSSAEIYRQTKNLISLSSKEG